MDWKKIGKKLLFPPIYLLVILVNLSAVALTFVFVKGMEQSIPAYIIYVLAFYTSQASTDFYHPHRCGRQYHSRDAFGNPYCKRK